MSSRLALSCAVLAGFLLGAVSVHPIARAVEIVKQSVTQCSGSPACLAISNTGNGLAILASSAEGDGVRVSAPHGSAIVATSGASDSAISATSGHVGLQVVSTGKNVQDAAAIALSTSGGDIFEGTGSGSFKIDYKANVHMTGLMYTGGKCAHGCLASTRVQSYSTTASLPTIEDAGEAQLIGGSIVVRLDPAFANAIDLQQGYLVLITPEGDTHGLYVAQRTIGGFTVRETLGGHSNIAFAYRIIAHPFGVREPRLPFVAMPRANP